jgi:signal transduction histidine kinase
MRAYVARLLGPRYDVESVADGQAALEAALDNPPDLVLTDVMMPRLDGFGLLRALRSNPRTAEIPVIFLSARAGEESRIEGMGAGADDYLVKPFSSRELIARVGAHLNLARVRREALESLAEASRRKDEFLAILAHELRNPLGPVRNAAHFLSQKELPDPELRRPLEMIERQVDQMARLIDDLLDVSRITRGMVELRLERLDFVEVAEATVDACRDDITARGHTLHVRLPQERVILNADRQRLVQVLGNLIGNAVKYTPPGGRIELAADVLDPDTLEVSVTDNGVGIPPGKLDEIFELFAQVDRSLERQGGLGIGLTLARQLVSLHGGTLQARSAGIGYGSTFIVRLPIAAWTPTEDVASTTRTRERPLPRRILVVDDNRDAVESMALLLSTDGHTVHVAFDGEGALTGAEAFQPEVVFLDIGMPRMDGHEVARRMRESAWGRSVHLVALTGWGQESDRQRSEEAGFDTHLVKPVSPVMLMSLLRSLEPQPQPTPTPEGESALP